MKIFAILMLLLAGAASANETYKPSTLPGYQLAVNSCTRCHSAQFAEMQSPSTPRAEWEATVKKMRKFGAQVSDEDVLAIAEYLAQAYGAEKPKP